MRQPSPVTVTDLAADRGSVDHEAAFDPSALPQLIEEALDRLLPPAEAHPQHLHRAMRYSVFSGGKRLRPQLLLRVAHACGCTAVEGDLAMRVACAVELIHAASLVHDDLPCFDDAAERRGRPTVHVQYGEPMAVLVGDALMALAFETISECPPHLAPRALRLLRLLGRAAGSASGIIGGQSMEQADGGHAFAPLSPEHIERYHQMKTGALFRLAAEAGGMAAGAANHAAWAQVGQLVGMWYQLADDLMDVCGHAQFMGKPVGQDAAFGRPNALLARGQGAVVAQMRGLSDEIRVAISTLSVEPEPLLAFLDGLRDHLLLAVGSVATLGADDARS